MCRPFRLSVVGPKLSVVIGVRGGSAEQHTYSLLIYRWRACRVIQSSTATIPVSNFVHGNMNCSSSVVVGGTGHKHLSQQHSTVVREHIVLVKASLDKDQVKII